MKRWLAALAALVAAIPLAHAEPISAAIAGATFLGLTGTAAVVAQVAVTVALVAASTIVQSQLAKPDAPTAPTSSGATLEVRYGGAVARSAIMGPGALGGHHVFTNVSGDTNDLLTAIFVVGDGFHGKMTALRYNGTPITLPADLDTSTYNVPEFLEPKLSTPLVRLRYYKGTFDQTADAILVGNSNPPGRWTSDHRGRGVAYVIVEQVYNEELGLVGVPSLLIETEGLCLYDPRKDDTNGGTGPHRWGLIDTYEPSDNPAIHEYNYRRGITIGGQRVIGMNVSPVNLLLDLYVAAANVNDEAVPLKEGGTEPRYRASITASDDRAHSDVLNAIRGATAGFTLERGGAFAPISGVAQIPISSLAFTDDDLLVGEKATFSKYRTRTELVTAVHGAYADPAQNWALVAFPARENPADDVAIGEKLAREIDLSQVFSSSQAQRIAEIERRRTLQLGKGTATLGARWIGVQPGDWLPYFSARHGTMNVLVTGTTLDTSRQTVTLTYERIASSVFSWTTAGELDPPTPGDPGVPGAIIMAASAMAAIGVNMPGDGGLIRPGIRFSWLPIFDPSVDQIDFEIRQSGDTNAMPFTADFPPAGSAVCVQGIQPATLYEYRHRLYTTPRRNTDFSAWLTVVSGSTQIVQQSLTTAPIEVTLADFEEGLRDLVSVQFDTVTEELDIIQQSIANAAAEQDAQNWLEKKLKASDIKASRDMVAAQYGARWRGTYSDEVQYSEGDQVEHLGDFYFATATPVIGTDPPAAPWQPLLNVARISEEWIAFAGPDGAAAQTSQSIETRFGSPTVTQTLAQVSSNWQAYAGTTGALASTHDQVVAAIDGSSVTIEGNATASAQINNNLAGAWQIKLDAAGHIGSIQLYGTPTTSAFDIVADVFRVAYPASMPGVTPEPVFQIQTVTIGGTPVSKLSFRGDMYADGTITGQRLVAGTITAVQIGAEAIEAGKIKAGAIDTGDLIVDNLIVTNHLTADAAMRMYQHAPFGTDSLSNGNDRVIASITSAFFETGKVIIQGEVTIEGSALNKAELHLEIDGSGVLFRIFRGGIADYTTQFLSGTGDVVKDPVRGTDGQIRFMVYREIGRGTHTIAMHLFNIGVGGKGGSINYVDPVLVALENRHKV